MRLPTATRTAACRVVTNVTIGHIHPLRTLVDESMAIVSDRLLCAGGGSDGHALLMDFSTLLAVTDGQRGCFVGTAAVPAADSEQLSCKSPSGFNGTASSKVQGLADLDAAVLPLPWQPGSAEVQLIGVVAQRRRHVGDGDAHNTCCMCAARSRSLCYVCFLVRQMPPHNTSHAAQASPCTPPAPHHATEWRGR
jgi:hypothetical protein